MQPSGQHTYLLQHQAPAVPRASHHLTLHSLPVSRRLSFALCLLLKAAQGR